MPFDLVEVVVHFQDDADSTEADSCNAVQTDDKLCNRGAAASGLHLGACNLAFHRARKCDVHAHSADYDHESTHSLAEPYLQSKAEITGEQQNQGDA